jgi:hypothetical protein
MTWFTANVTLTNGSQLVTWNSGDPILKLNARDGLIVNGGTPIEVLSIGSVDFLLKDNWPGTTATVEVTAQPTAGDFTDATKKLREVSTFASSLYGQLTDWAAAATQNVTITDAAGNNTLVPTPKMLTDVIETLGTAANADVTSSITGGVAGQVTTVGYGGLGSVSFMDLRLTNIDNIHKTGFYGGYGGNNGLALTGDNPFPDSGGGFALAVHKGINNLGNQYVVQEAADFSGSLVTKKIRSRNSGVWSAWVTLFHTGNSVNPLDFGLKEAVTLSADDDLDTLIETKVWFNPTASYTPNNNYPFASAGSLFVIARASSNVTQEFVKYADGVLSRKWFRSKGTAGWSDWQEIYHSGNTNFNVFGGAGTGDVIANGVATSNTHARFYLPINSIATASGITASGTFNINRSDGTTLQTSVSPAFNNLSSNKMVVLIVGATGLTKGEPLDLRKSSSTSKITVNY